jgi:hypothetical protein
VSALKADQIDIAEQVLRDEVAAAAGAGFEVYHFGSPTVFNAREGAVVPRHPEHSRALGLAHRFDDLLELRHLP